MDPAIAATDATIPCNVVAAAQIDLRMFIGADRTGGRKTY
jgi:hypothetical protein